MADPTNKINGPVSALKQSLRNLQVQRDALEHESAAVASELTAVNPNNPTAPPMGIDTPLVDQEGYPRNDVDVYRARTLRKRLAEIRTDHKQLTNDMERHLRQLALFQNPEKSQQEQHEQSARLQSKPKPKYDPVSGKWVVRNWDGSIAGAGPQESSNNMNRNFDALVLEDASDADRTDPMQGVTATTANTPEQQQTTAVVVVHRAAADIANIPSTPWARVESVADGSPAAEAGVQKNDTLLAFGPIVTMTNNTAISELVQTAAANHERIELVVRRSGTSSDNNDATAAERLRLELAPRPWNGRGLIGCHIVPV